MLKAYRGASDFGDILCLHQPEKWSSVLSSIAPIVTMKINAIFFVFQKNHYIGNNGNSFAGKITIPLCTVSDLFRCLLTPSVND